MKMTKQEYMEYLKTKSEKSPIVKNCINAFLIGGLICTIGQVILNIYKSYGLSDDVSAGATSLTLIFVGGFLTGINVYDKIAKYGGAGTIVPITGFANSIVSPAMEFKSEGYVMGMAAKMFVVAGPVLVFGTVSSIIYGLIIFLFGLY